jgi:hypothetical protein
MWCRCVRGREVRRIHKDKLDALAGVRFRRSDITELVELAATYHQRFNGPALPDYMLLYAPITRQQPATTELVARRAFVEAVEGVWRERRGGRGRAAFSSKTKKLDGPLLRLLRELFVAMGEQPPSDATLYDDIIAIEQQHERRR